MSLTSPSHRAALWFLRGGLVAIVASLVPAQFGIVSRDAPVLAPLVSFLRIAVPALGFALGGAVGGSALGLGRPGVLGSGAALFVTGIALSLLMPPLTGLTGFENPVTVLLFSATASGSAFAAGGVILGLLLARRFLARLAGGFFAGGVAGGIVSVLPAILAAPLGWWPADAQLFVRLLCSLVGLLGPFAVAGAVAGGAVSEDRRGYGSAE